MRARRSAKPILAVFLCAAITFGLSRTAVAQTNLIVNGSFENGTYAPLVAGSWVDVKTGDTKLAGWTVDGWLNWHNNGHFKPLPDGDRVVDLNNGGTGTGTGRLSQTFATIPGHEYLLTFQLAGPNHPAFPNPRSVVVEVAGQQYTFSTPASNNLNLQWTTQTQVFVANSPLITLTFSSPDETGFWGPVLDLVSVVATNRPPDVSAATPSVSSIWPPNNKMVDIAINGVTDPDGDAVSITITGITNNETGSADAGGIGTSTAQVRAARNGKGNGRTYTISFTASDGKGGTASSSVQVVVAHDQGKKAKPAGVESSSWGEIKSMAR